MKKARIQELRRILKKNPGILDSLHPLEKAVAVRLCKGLDTRGKPDGASSHSQT